MAEPADRALLEGLAAVGAALEDLGAPAMVIGGIAVIARGVPRQTVDVDATVWAEAVEVDALLDLLARHDIRPRIADAAAFAQRHQVLLLRHDPSGTPVEISFAWLPFEREALARATLVDFAGVRVRVATPEDLVVYKAVAWRDRDRSDVERLLTLHGDGIDLARVRSLIREFADALDEPERVPAFEAIVARITRPRDEL